jgi:hypothetical protein
MPHTLVFTASDYGDGTQILFTCSTCGKEIAFAREGSGDPFSRFNSLLNEWDHPADPETWLGPCEE